LIPLSVQILVGGIVAASILVFVSVRFRRPHIYKLFPGLLTKGYQQRLMLGAGEGEAEGEPIEELSTLGKILTSNRTWSSTAVLEALLIAGIAMFYLTATMIEWRIRRNIVGSGIAPSLDVSIIQGNAILNGPVSTEDLYVEASRKAAEIVGSGRVVNRLQVEQPEILGEASDQIGEAEIAIDSLYDDSQESIRQIEEVVNLPLFETTTVRRGVSLQQLIASRYGIDSSNLPNSYEVVRHRIEWLNKWVLPQPTPGSLRVPPLPARFAARGSRMTARLRDRGKSIIQFEANRILGSLLQLNVSLRPRRTLSRTVLLQIPFTRATAVETQRSARLLESSMTVQFASSGTTSSAHKSLDADDSKAVIDALKRQARRPATVFVLDSGWPDESSYRDSIAELRKLVDTAMEFYGLGRVQWADLPYVPLPNDDKSQHCAYIRNSLSEFTDLDSGHIVKVVYVPLDTKQNAQQILHEMLRLYHIRTVMQRDTQVDDDTKMAAEDFATQTVNSIASSEPFDLERPNATTSDSKYRQRWRTNSAIVAAVWYLAELAAEQNSQNPVFFLNESWTVIPDTVEFGAPGVSSGIVIAAAGNTPGKEVNTDTGKIDFAREATPAKNVLAALDTKPGLNKPFCDSSQLSLDTLSGTMAASYDGEAVDGGLCGTSFSAPRIAWLLALAEATRTEDLQQSAWAVRLQQKLLAIRKQSPSMFEGLYLHPKDLLQ
jgi:hypothetical protein